jgi:hypothetical protein
MTACLFISPKLSQSNPEVGIVPFVIADTMATLVIAPSGAVPLIPANPEMGDARSSTVNLVRKIALFGDTAVACAGNGQLIETAIYEIGQQLADWRERDRPMRLLGDMADRAGISVIGVHLRVNAEKKYELMHVAPTSSRIETRHLGQCAAVGSGGNALLVECQEADLVFDAWDLERATTYDKVLGFVNAVNGRRLANELLGTAGARSSWGAYLEWAHFDFMAHRWRFGFKTLHLFYMVAPIPGGFTLHFTGCGVAFDPNEEQARALSLLGSRVREFRFDNVAARGRESSVSRAEFWHGWEPETVCVTVIGGQPDGEPLLVPRTLTRAEMSGALFEVTPTYVFGGLTAKLLHELGHEIGRLVHQNYVPTMKDRPNSNPPTSSINR